MRPQFFQIAVIDVMSAPVRHSVELDAVREFHCGAIAAELLLTTMAKGSWTLSEPTFRCTRNLDMQKFEFDVGPCVRPGRQIMRA